MFGAWGCSSCHDAVDGRTDVLVCDYEVVTREYFYEGVFRTQNILLGEGKLGE
jgi:hypothetical protein